MSANKPKTPNALQRIAILDRAASEYGCVVNRKGAIANTKDVNVKYLLKNEHIVLKRTPPHRTCNETFFGMTNSFDRFSNIQGYKKSGVRVTKAFITPSGRKYLNKLIGN